MRDADRDELAALGVDPSTALGDCVKKSSVSLTVVDEHPIAMFGCHRIQITPSLTYGSIWCLGTEAIKQHGKWIACYSHQWVEHIEKGCQYSGNVVDSRNTPSVRWLRWLGFSFLRRVPVGGQTFLEFVRICAFQEQKL